MRPANPEAITSPASLASALCDVPPRALCTWRQQHRCTPEKVPCFWLSSANRLIALHSQVIILVSISTMATHQECIVCAETKETTAFPAEPLTSDCEHPSHTCAACVSQTIRAHIEHESSVEVPCPECSGILAAETISHYADPPTVQRYDTLCFHSLMEGDTTFVWVCATTSLNPPLPSSRLLMLMVLVPVCRWLWQRADTRRRHRPAHCQVRRVWNQILFLLQGVVACWHDMRRVELSACSCVGCWRLRGFY